MTDKRTKITHRQPELDGSIFTHVDGTKVPLVVYDSDGKRTVIGESHIEMNNGEAIVTSFIDEEHVGKVLPSSLEYLSIGPFSTRKEK